MRTGRSPACPLACLTLVLLSCQAIVGLEKKDLPLPDAALDGDTTEEAEPDGQEEIPQDPSPDPDALEEPEPDVNDAVDMDDPDALDTDEELPVSAFRDDFDSATLDPGWTFEDPLGDCSYSLSLSPGHFVFSLPEGVTHDCWSDGNNCPRLVRSFAAGDWEVAIGFTGSAFLMDSSSAGIYFGQNDANLLRFEFYFGHGELRANAYSVIGGVGSNRLEGPLVALQDTNFLRVVKASGSYTFSFSLDGAAWTEVGTVDEPGLLVRHVGIHVINYTPDADPPPPIDVAVDFYSQTPL